MNLSKILFILSFVFTQVVLAKSLTCSGLTKLKHSKGTEVTKLSLELHPIQDTKMSYITFKFEDWDSRTSGAINFNVDQVASPQDFDLIFENARFFGSLSLIPHNDTKCFLELDSRITSDKQDNDVVDINGVLECKWINSKL